MKNKTLISLLLIAGIIILVAGFIWTNHKINLSYKDAIELIHQEKFNRAIAVLEDINPGKDIRYNLDYYTKFGTLRENYHKDSFQLYAYALARREYIDGKDMIAVNRYLKAVPENYKGSLASDIHKFRKEFEPEFKAYIEEKRQRDALAEKQRIKEKKERLKNTLPYEGMSENDIDYTMMGTHDKLIADDDNDDFVYNVYYWNANNGDTMLAVSCINGEVDHVSKYYEWAYWTSDGRPKPNGTNYTRSSSKNTGKSEDPYDVNEYSDPEDFYYDNYDDFWEYEEAEDYYNDYHD